MFQSLFYWITYSYNRQYALNIKGDRCFNPYFIGLPILMSSTWLSGGKGSCFNPYFIGLPILIKTVFC